MFTAVMAAATGAWACAGLVHEESELAESDHATVAFEVTSGGSAVTYSVGYVGDAAEFGWVIPVPGDVTGVGDGDAEWLAELAAVSAPVVFEEEAMGDPSSGGCSLGCGAALKGSDATPGGFDDVTVVGEGFTGTYEYVILESSDGVALQGWLDEHGWTGLAADDLEHYAAEVGVFVALVLSPDVATTPSEGRELPPIRIDTTSDELRFPSVMARHAAVSTQRTTLFVVGDSRAVVDGWTSEDPPGALSADGVEPGIAFLAHLGALGEDRGLLRSWAGDFDGRFVTRFDLFAPAEVHTEDALFSFEASTDPLQTEIDASSGTTTAAVGGLGLLGLWARRRSRR